MIQRHARIGRDAVRRRQRFVNLDKQASLAVGTQRSCEAALLGRPDRAVRDMAKDGAMTRGAEPPWAGISLAQILWLHRGIALQIW